MALLDTDLLLVERAGVSYKLAWVDFESKLQGGDLLLVERGGVSYKQDVSQLWNIQDTDTVLIERGGVSYKAPGSEINQGLGQPITFELRINSRGKKEYLPDRGPAFGNQPGTWTSNGTELRCTVSCLSSDTYSFGGTAPTVSINGEWQVMCGQSGGMGRRRLYSESNGTASYSYTYYPGNQQVVATKGFGPIGFSDIQDGQVGDISGNPNSTYDFSGSGGRGAPRGANGGSSGVNAGNGGTSQLRCRAENTGNTYAGVTVTNASLVQTNNYDTGNYANIIYNGQTYGLLTNGQTFGELLGL